MKNTDFRRGMICGVCSGLSVVAAAAILWMLYGIYSGREVIVTTAESGKQTIVNESTVQKIGVIEGLIEENFLDEFEESELQEGLYAGMIAALEDPYSVYYSEEELQDARSKAKGVYYGIGAGVGVDAETGLPRISKVYEDSPAQEAGMLEGDLLYKVAGEEVTGLELSEVVNLIKGEEGTKVSITVLRETEGRYVELEVERREIETQTVESRMLEDGIAYIQITEFDDVTLDQFTEALAVCKGSGMKGLVLDLRGNPGGNVTTVCEIARKILPEGLIVYTEDKNGKRTEYSCDGSSELQVPLTVLVNGNSASASEILAGAIKDHKKGTLVGTTTYGKGIVQRIIGLSDGSAVKLTVSNYFTPNGNNIHKVGITPDVEIPFDAEAYVNQGVDNQLQKAVEILKEEIGE